MKIEFNLSVDGDVFAFSLNKLFIDSIKDNLSSDHDDILSLLCKDEGDCALIADGFFAAFNQVAYQSIDFVENKNQLISYFLKMECDIIDIVEKLDKNHSLFLNNKTKKASDMFFGLAKRIETNKRRKAISKVNEKVQNLFILRGKIHSAKCEAWRYTIYNLELIREANSYILYCIDAINNLNDEISNIDSEESMSDNLIIIKKHKIEIIKDKLKSILIARFVLIKSRDLELMAINMFISVCESINKLSKFSKPIWSSDIYEINSFDLLKIEEDYKSTYFGCADETLFNCLTGIHFSQDNVFEIHSIKNKSFIVTTMNDYDEIFKINEVLKNEIKRARLNMRNNVRDM